ncbi:MAG: hypothetical protein F2667_04640 [Actinobacteria bacterium]|uniref:Unannotated protein n=1 Tax=freshwater metagenome TaxID=449393 RepID=A0A6J6PV99_9ZZZZ|nr:hypothetical protein [Actinomycetota bacterium]
MRRTLATAAVAALAVTALALPTAADPRPSTAETASAVLARASHLLSASPAPRRTTGPAARTDVSLALADLVAVLPALGARERSEADALLKRPTDGRADGYTVPSTKKCGGRFCVHYVTSTADAPPDLAWVRKTLSLMNRVWRFEVDRLGYDRPPSDGATRRNGGNAKFDVYLQDLGARTLYGYCAPEDFAPGSKRRTTSYCVLDNDFSSTQFGAPAADSLRVTAAHEFFHAIQFGYDYREDRWLLESTATWMEERFADATDDNLQYLDHGQLAKPGSSLDVYDADGFNQYANWVWWEYLAERFGNGIVRQVWDQAGEGRSQGKAYSTQAVARVLARRSSLTRVFAAYAAANTAPAATYAEGHKWPAAEPLQSWTLSPSSPRATTTATINHLASQSVEIRPDPALIGAAWSVTATVDGPGRATSPAAYLSVEHRDGRWTRRAISLSRRGVGTTRFPFSAESVVSATVTLANTSTRFRCGTGGRLYSCHGTPRDQREEFAVSVELRQRPVR